MNILLVEPDFPYSTKSKQQANSSFKNFIPVGLLKLGAYYKSQNHKVRITRGNKKNLNDFKPDMVGITSLFTYWSKYMWDSVEYYRKLFPKAKIEVGGVYVTLHHETAEFKKLAKIFNVFYHVGTHPKAEKFLPDYSLIPPVEYHLTHAMRGCIRRCKFCGTWKIEPKLIYKKTDALIDEIKNIGKNKVIFLDNNFFANPYVKQNLTALSELKIDGKSVTFESQSGFDGRLLAKDPELAKLLKKARFENIRIAWDNGFSDKSDIQKQINHLVNAGYNSKDLSVFMIYNFDIPYEQMLKKIQYCKKWKVQITDCRYRPLTSTYDNYNPSKRSGQTREDYYIHEDGNWTDQKVRSFRRKVRQHNIEIRYGGPYNQKMERWSAIHNTFKFFGLDRPPKMNIIDNSKVWKRRIKILKSLKNMHLKNKTQPDKIKEAFGPKFDKEITRRARTAGLPLKF